MVLYQLLAAAVIAPQTPSKPALPPAFRIGRDELKAGNPFAGYITMLNAEKDYDADEGERGSYWQARSTLASQLGNYEDADKSWDVAFHFQSPNKVYKSSALARMKPVDALDFIEQQADGHRWIMLGEEHVKPQTRSILIPLLRRLCKKGFRVFAAETFDEHATERIGKLGYPDYEFGTYTADPVFAAGVREAVRLGYKIVPYESYDEPKDLPANDPEAAQNFRERQQAEHLKTRIFDKDPNAKVIVWAGRAHIYEGTDKDPSGSEWKPMAHEFKQLTGQDPLTVYLATYFEHSERRLERPEYLWATDRGLVKGPTVFVGKDGKAFGAMFDAQVFFPRTTYIQGRPDWMANEMARTPHEIPDALIKPEGRQLAQVFAKGEPITAIPIDQVLIQPNQPVPALMLPKGEYWMRVLDAEGRENGRTELKL